MKCSVIRAMSLLLPLSHLLLIERPSSLLLEMSFLHEVGNNIPKSPLPLTGYHLGSDTPLNQLFIVGVRRRRDIYYEWHRLGKMPSLRQGGVGPMHEIFMRTTGRDKKAPCQSMNGTGPTKPELSTMKAACASSGRILVLSKSITCGPVWMMGI